MTGNSCITSLFLAQKWLLLNWSVRLLLFQEARSMAAILAQLKSFPAPL